MTRFAALMLILSLAACGVKGPLVLPPGPAPEPLFGNPKPAPAPTTPAAKGDKESAENSSKNGPDVSTDAPAQKP